MNKKLLFLLILLIQQFAFGQSPFNYGQNKKVYFISTALRNKLGIKTIYSIDQRFENDRGGMNENWDVSVISFDTNLISDQWSPISLDSTYKYRFDSLTSNLQFLNGKYYEFANNELTAYGGGGYGSFDHKDIYKYSDTVSIIVTSCVGHCGDQPMTYSKNIFNKKGQLLYTVFYPTPSKDWGIDANGDTTTLADYERSFISLINGGHSADTLFYKYDNNDLLLNTSEIDYITNSSDVKKLFTYPPQSYVFHQCYIGKTKMEKYFLRKIGFTPELVLIEIYKYGVFSFVFNNTDKKYYQTGNFTLEQ